LAGIYLHIPFCKQACSYCNFHFSTSLALKKEMVDAICLEAELRVDYLSNQPIETLYFGGGTPSLLNQKELNQLFDRLAAIFNLSGVREITLEANPDDLSREKLMELKDTPVNRLSIGIQSFDEDELRFMRRAHTARQSLECVELARKAGFDNVSIDLIYGVPGPQDNTWETNLAIMANMEVPHLSCYALTVEPRTILHHEIDRGKMPPLDEEKAAREYMALLEFSEREGYEAYEISNFAKPGRYSLHNTSYWQGKTYLGLGPSAHSFNGLSRSWNPANNARYIKSLAQGMLPLETEVLSTDDRYNEWVMTGLRTQWGLPEEELAIWPAEIQRYFLEGVKEYIRLGQITLSDGHYRLAKNARLFADGISAALFFTR
jgi:oxygen-independent coproporphyrinogen III oxidase